MNGKKIIIYTCVYNGEKTISQTIDSVLNQTYKNFEYHITDNGSTDKTRKIIEEYAKKDSRIVLYKREKNHLLTGEAAPYILMVDVLSKKYPNQYLSIIDGDDWWEPDYLERLINFLEANDLDLAVTGTVNYFEENHSEKVMRQLPSPVVLTQKQFAQYYPQLWTFPSTNWASIAKLDIYRQIDMEMFAQKVLDYGGDTATMLEYIKHCRKIGIDNSALYHYRIHPQGISYQYNPRRFDSNVGLTEMIREFLEQHQTFDAEKQTWLNDVHVHSMTATLGILYQCQISTAEKLTECVRIVEHPMTAQVLTEPSETCDTWYNLVRGIVSQATGNATTATEEAQIKRILQCISPDCANVFSLQDRTLYAAEPAFWTAIMKNQPEAAREMILNWIVEGRYVEQFNLGQMLNRLIPDGFLLKDESDTQFFGTYADSCRLIFENSMANALEQMTGVLLENESLYAEEHFLKLYLSLAALQNEIPAFLFGNLHLAYFYYNEGRREECRSVVADLEEMGAGDDEDVINLRHALDSLP